MSAEKNNVVVLDELRTDDDFLAAYIRRSNKLKPSKESGLKTLMVMYDPLTTRATIVSDEDLNRLEVAYMLKRLNEAYQG